MKKTIAFVAIGCIMIVAFIPKSNKSDFDSDFAAFKAAADNYFNSVDHKTPDTVLLKTILFSALHQLDQYGTPEDIINRVAQNPPSTLPYCASGCTAWLLQCLKGAHTEFGLLDCEKGYRDCLWLCH